MMKSQITIPQIKSTNELYDSKTLIEVLKEMLEEEFKFGLYNQSKTKFILSKFTYYCFNRLNIPIEEIKYFKINVDNVIDILQVNPANLFTATILYGRYVPYDIIKNLKSYQFNDATIYMNDLGEAVIKYTK